MAKLKMALAWLVALAIILPIFGSIPVGGLIYGLAAYFVIGYVMKAARAQGSGEAVVYNETHHHHYAREYETVQEGLQTVQELPDGTIVRQQHVRKWN